MGVRLLFLRCYPRINDSWGLPNTGCREVNVQALSVSHCPSVALHEVSLIARLMCVLCLQVVQMLWIKHCPGGSVTGCSTSTCCRRTRLLSHPLERLSQSKAATGQCCCSLQGAGRYCVIAVRTKWEWLGEKGSQILLLYFGWQNKVLFGNAPSASRGAWVLWEWREPHVTCLKSSFTTLAPFVTKIIHCG